MSAAWALCVMLDWSDPSTRICEAKPDEATCIRDMQDWLARWRAWQKRSGIDHPMLVVCGPAGVIGP